MDTGETASIERPKCPNCDVISIPGARFCSRCGTRLDAALVPDSTGALQELPASFTVDSGSGPLPVVPDHPVEGAVLAVHRPAQYEGRRYVLDEDVVTLGRATDSTIFLDDVTVSRHHAELLNGAAGWLLRDKESLNGTYVNRTRVEQARLANGDEVQIGKFRFIFWTAA